MVSNDYPTVEESDYVQEMVRKDPLHIPARYTRSEEDKAKDVDLSANSSEIPILDLTLLSNENSEELENFENACKDWGFFQVIYHGVTAEVMQSVKNGKLGFSTFQCMRRKSTPLTKRPSKVMGERTPSLKIRQWTGQIRY